MTKVFVSTCHICIEELSYDPKEIKKSVVQQMHLYVIVVGMN